MRDQIDYEVDEGVKELGRQGYLLFKIIRFVVVFFVLLYFGILVFKGMRIEWRESNAKVLDPDVFYTLDWCVSNYSYVGLSLFHVRDPQCILRHEKEMCVILGSRMTSQSIPAVCPKYLK